MAKYRNALPQLGGNFFITDGGLETTLIFHDGFELPEFAAFCLLKSVEGEAALKRYFRTYAKLARDYEVGLILETATWRASSFWGEKLGYSESELARENRRAVSLMVDIRQEFESSHTPIVISGCIGPKGDGYTVSQALSEQEAEEYHQVQINTLADTAVDLVSGLTLNESAEAIGMVRAARRAGIPIVISFTVETDGNLPSGQPLSEAIRQVDQATFEYPAYYMINCAHPDHVSRAIGQCEPWTARVRGLRANASKLSHAQLNESTVLDDGDPQALSRDYAHLMTHQLRNLNILGGCCGTDHRHVEQIIAVCLPLFRRQHA